MLSFVCFVLFFASTAVLTAVVVEDPQDLCSDLEFNCGDGDCVTLNSFCDGKFDCDDGSDETGCYLGASSDLMSRVKRQATGRCSKVQWQCRDGSCIHFDGKCDGIVDCPDGSDETHPLCRKNLCQSNWFRCTYGACVDGAAPCNGVQDCADNSDELLPRCRREVQEVRGQFKCLSGEFISASLHCDGVRDCADGSDETVRACAGKTCPEYLFQCAYGACVDQGADCNGIKECADGSDESDELCNRTTTIVTESPIKPTTSTPALGGKCVLPPYPKHGRYVVSGSPKAKPGQAFDVVALNITCSAGYDVIGKKDRICYNGYWSASMSDCVRFCRLNKDPSVQFKCLLEGDAQGYRECNPFEPVGTIVKPECNSPNYYSSGVLNYMHCVDGSWDRIPHCLPGLTKNGTNVTILIKEDDYEIHVGTFQYAVQTVTPSYTPPNSNQNIPSYVPPNSNQNIPSYVPPNSNQNSPSYVPPNSNQNTPSYMPPNSGQNIPSYIPPNSNQNIPSNTPPNTNQNIPNYTPPNANQNIPNYTPPNTNQNTPNYIPPNSDSSVIDPQQVTPVTPAAPDYDLEDTDWRFLDDRSDNSPQSNSLDTHSRFKGHSDSNKRKDFNVNVKVNNMEVHAQRGKVEVLNRDRIVFRD